MRRNLPLLLLGLLPPAYGCGGDVVEFDSGGRDCCASVMHGRDGLSLVRATSETSLTVVDAGAEAEITFRLEVAADGSTWVPLTWGQLELHHGRRIHVVIVGADADTFLHTHPDNFGSIVDDATLFTVNVTLPVAQRYTVSAQFYFDANNVTLCVDESAMHVHASSSVSSNAVYILEGQSFGVTAVVPGASAPPPAAVASPPWHFDRGVASARLPGMDTAVVAQSRRFEDQFACCTGSTNTATTAGCVRTELQTFEFVPNGQPLRALGSGEALRIAGAAPRRCHVFQLRFTSPSGAGAGSAGGGGNACGEGPMTDLALWLDAPAHLLLARTAGDGSRPDKLVHFHAMPGPAVQAGAASFPNRPNMAQVLSGECAGQMGAMVSAANIANASYRFGPYLWAATPMLDAPGNYTLFATLKYDGGAGAGAGAGLVMPAFTFEVKESFLAPDAPKPDGGGGGMRVDVGVCPQNSQASIAIGCTSTTAPTLASTSVSPTTSTPTASPSTSPSTSPATTIPTPSPATALPTASPSTSPATTIPTPSPATALPTAGPSTSPSTSPATTIPTPSPATALPTPSPTTSVGQLSGSGGGGDGDGGDGNASAVVGIIVGAAALIGVAVAVAVAVAHRRHGGGGPARPVSSAGKDLFINPMWGQDPAGGGTDGAQHATA